MGYAVLNDLTLIESNAIQLKNPDGEIVDKVGWGQSQDFETSPAQNPQLGQTIGRKWVEGAGYQDADNNSSDFEIQLSTPKAKNNIASIQFCFCSASIKAIPKNKMKTVIFVNFIFFITQKKSIPC